MTRVEIYKLQNDGQQKVVVTCYLENDRVRFEGEPGFIESLEKSGITNHTNFAKEGKKLLPTDGLIFLENLKFAFNSGYLVASDIIEE